MMENSSNSLGHKHAGKVAQLESAGDKFQAILADLINDLKHQQYNPSEFNHHSLLPDVIARYRQQHVMNQGTLALLAGVTPNTMAKLNKNHTSMRVETLLSILQVLGLTLYIGPVDG